MSQEKTMLCDHVGKRQACDACPHSKDHAPVDGCNIRGIVRMCYGDDEDESFCQCVEVE